MKTGLICMAVLMTFSLVIFFDVENGREIKRESETRVGQYYAKELKTLKIEWVYDKETLKEFLNLNKNVDTVNEVIVGFANISEDKCVIYAYKPPDSINGRIDLETPRNKIKLQILGHELMHCFMKDLHD